MTVTSTPPGIALVTGAARRIGRAIALKLAGAGWDIAVHYNQSKDDAQALATEIGALGRRAVTVAADLSDAGAVAGLVPATVAAIGAPALLVNNASLFLPDEAGNLTPGLWDRHQAVNLRAPVMLAQAFAVALPEGAQGNVVNIVDQRVWKPTPLFFSYAVSKAGLYAANIMLAQALAPRIRVNAIGPGPTAQNIHQRPEQFAAESAALLLGRGPNPDEIAEAVLFLVSAGAMTGQMIALDGGQHLAWQTAEVVAAHDGAWRAPAPPRPSPAMPATAGIRHVLINDLELMTMIGVHDAERRAPQRVLVTADLSVREAGPATSDQLPDVVDYAEVIARIEQVVKAGHINLVETLAERVAEVCLADPRTFAVEVRIEKPDVIPNARAVGVEIRRQKA